MSCAACQDIQDVSEEGGLYVIRGCSGCGRQMKLREPGAHGIGIKIEKGDQVVLPASALKISANPLKGGGHLSRTGLDWYQGLVFAHEELLRRSKDFPTALEEMIKANDDLLESLPLLAEFDLEDPKQSDIAFEKLKQHPNSAEGFLFFSGGLLSIAKEAIKDNDAALAAWAMASAERYRAVFLFKEHFEEVVWMGRSAKRLTDMLGLWDSNKTNGDEEFWQIQFQSHSLALSQLFSVPVTLIQGKAYVGGQGIDRNDARLVDFLFTRGSAQEAILIEIKTPVTPLLRTTPYRKNAHAPSEDLAGSVVQVADYRRSFTREINGLLRDGNHNISAFNPKCLIIVGTSSELDTEVKRRSFELFRSGLLNVEVVTFDEIFAKIESLASLFNLVRKPASPST